MKEAAANRNQDQPLPFECSIPLRVVYSFGRAILASGGGGGFKLHLETRILPFAIDVFCDHEVAYSAVRSTDDQQGMLGRRSEKVRSHVKIMSDSGSIPATHVISSTVNDPGPSTSLEATPDESSTHDTVPADEALPTANRNAKAVKHDDAPVPVHLWNNRISVRQGTAETVKTRVLDYARDRLLGKMCLFKEGDDSVPSCSAWFP